MNDDCPGRNRCHGPANFCDTCGDVTHVCDDPRCDAHSRIDELVEEAELRMQEAQEAARKADEALTIANNALHDLQAHVRGNARMVPRER